MKAKGRLCPAHPSRHPCVPFFSTQPPVRALPLPHRRPSACPAHLPRHPCVPYLTLPRRVRFASHLCS